MVFCQYVILPSHIITIVRWKKQNGGQNPHLISLITEARPLFFRLCEHKMRLWYAAPIFY